MKFMRYKNKRLLYVLIFVTGFMYTSAQENTGKLNVFKRKNSGWLGVQIDHSYNFSESQTSFGINMNYFPFEKFSIGYSFLIGFPAHKTIYMYSGAAQPLGVVLLDAINNFGSSWGTVGVICLLMPESFEYHIDLSENTNLGFFVSPYGTEYQYNTETHKEILDISGEVGTKLYFSPVEEFQIVPQIGVKKFYTTRNVYITFGFTGYYMIK